MNGEGDTLIYPHPIITFRDSHLTKTYIATSSTKPGLPFVNSPHWNVLDQQFAISPAMVQQYGQDMSHFSSAERFFRWAVRTIKLHEDQGRPIRALGAEIGLCMYSVIELEMSCFAIVSTFLHLIAPNLLHSSGPPHQWQWPSQPKGSTRLGSIDHFGSMEHRLIKVKNNDLRTG